MHTLMSTEKENAIYMNRKCRQRRCCTCSVWYEGFCWWHFIDRNPRAIQCNEYKRKFELDYGKTNKRNKELQPGEHKEGL